MDIETKLEKMLNILDSNDLTKQKIHDCIAALEAYHDIKEKDRDVAFYPLEENLQLPNVFLRTKKNPEVEKFIRENQKPIGNFIKWNKNLDALLNKIETSEIVDEVEEDEVEDVKCNIENLQM
ncbi:hypothetical protein COBT_002177, partial [Conglomerata obtusa]